MSFNRITDLTDVMEASDSLQRAFKCKLMENRVR
jgi:hypothetical protein